MLETIQFDADQYDLEGLLGKSEMAGADLIFMAYEEETESYYMDRMEVRKYDSSFSRLIMRVKDYLEKDSDNGLFVLFANIQGGCVDLYDGTYRKKQTMALGDIDPEEDCFYGIMIHFEEGMYVFREAVYINAHYEGDARAAIIQNAGALSDLVYDFVLDFE